MEIALGIGCVVFVLAGLTVLYIKTRNAVGAPQPIVGEQQIEADFDVKKKAEADRIAHLDQEELLADLNHRNRPGGN